MPRKPVVHVTCVTYSVRREWERKNFFLQLLEVLLKLDLRWTFASKGNLMKGICFWPLGLPIIRWLGFSFAYTIEMFSGGWTSVFFESVLVLINTCTFISAAVEGIGDRDSLAQEEKDLLSIQSNVCEQSDPFFWYINFLDIKSMIVDCIQFC